MRPLLVVCALLLGGCLRVMTSAPERGQVSDVHAPDGRPDLGGTSSETIKDRGLGKEQGTVKDQGFPVDHGSKADKKTTGDAGCTAVGTGGLTITSCPVTSIYTGMSYQYQVVATGPGPYSWALETFPAGMTISASGLISWTAGFKGTFPVSVRVSNASGSAVQSYDVFVACCVNGLRPASLAAAVERGLGSLAARPLAACGLSQFGAAARYLAGCALPAGASVDGLEGELGLAPEWQHRPCDERCRQRVSACVLARLNTRGERRLVELAGPDGRGLEGAFFGDLFAPRPRLLACLGTQTLARPRCLGLAGCPVEVVGRCLRVCDQRGCRDREGQRYLSLAVRVR